MKTKTIAMIMAMVMIVVCMVSGTLAWLTDSTGDVQNTFTTADIDITLTETPNTDTNNDGKNDKWQAQMIPGFSYAKDPVVTVKANSVDCYLFVKFEVTGDATYLSYTSLLNGNGWTQGTGNGTGGNGVPTNVWFREVTSSTSDQSWNLLSGKHEIAGCERGEDCTCTFVNGFVTISDTLTKGNMPTTAPELKYTAFATQLYKESGSKFTEGEAWDKVKPADPTPVPVVPAT